MLCLHPIEIVDRAFAKYRPLNTYGVVTLQVPCGKCANCLKNKQLSWCNRLQMHCDSYKYSHFITLTYDEMHVPYFNTQTGDIFRLSDDEINLDYVNLEYCVPCALREDIKAFIHKLRRYIDNHYNLERIKPLPEELQITYFCVSEYGMEKYRPHYHLLLFHNIDKLNKNIIEVVNKCWDLPK